MLCNICIGVLKHRANLISVDTAMGVSYIENAHHRTTQSLQSSAEEGCHVCLPLWNQLAPHGQEALRAAEKERIHDGEANLIGTIELTDWLTQTMLYPSEVDYDDPSEANHGEFGFVAYFTRSDIVAGAERREGYTHTLQLISGSTWEVLLIEFI